MKYAPRAEKTAVAQLRGVKGSVQKAGLVLDVIRGQKVENALADLQFSKKRLSVDLHKLLMSAVANAQNNHDLNIDQLYVKEAWAGKNIVMKRFRARARGRMGKLLKPRVNMTVVVEEREAKKAAPKAKDAPKKQASDSTRSSAKPSAKQKPAATTNEKETA